MNARAKKQLLLARDALAKCVTSSHAAQSSKAKLERKLGSVSIEIEKLERRIAADPCDSRAVSRLSVLKDQAALLCKRIETDAAASLDQTSADIRLQEAFDIVRDAINLAMKPQLEGLMRRAESALTPFYNDPGKVASRCDTVLNLEAFIEKNTRGLQMGGHAPEHVLKVLDQLLAGKTVWSWKPD